MPEYIVKLRAPFPYVIWWAIFVHMAWGIALVYDSTITPLVVLVGLHWVSLLGIDSVELGYVLIVAAIMATVGILAENRLPNRICFLLLLPQYALLVAAFVSDTQTIVVGEITNTSGVVINVDRLVLFTVLCPVMIAAVLHSFAIIERFRLWTLR